MKYDKTLRLINRFEGEIRSTVRQGIDAHWDYTRFLSALRLRVWDKLPEDLPRWAFNRIQGHEDGQMNLVCDILCEWRVRLDGELIRGRDVPAGRWSEVETGALVWVDAPEHIFSDGQA